MFGGAFRESDAAVVELPGKLYDDLLELICVLHPPNKPIDGKTLCIKIMTFQTSEEEIFLN